MEDVGQRPGERVLQRHRGGKGLVQPTRFPWGGARGVRWGTQGWREPISLENLTLMRSCPPYPKTFAALNGPVSPGHAQDNRVSGSQLDGEGGAV